MSSYSAFDCLAIGNGIENAIENFSSEELHIFAYLGCLLSLYRNQPVSEWGYSFIVSTNGKPFSYDIKESFDEICLLGYIEPLNNYYKLSSKGKMLFDELKTLHQYSKRLPLLEGACASLLAIPMDVVRNAVANVPEIKRATLVKSVRSLLSKTSLDQLYEQFRILSNTFGIEIADLMIPATAWLSYLAQAD